MYDEDNYSIESRNRDYEEIKTNRMIKYAKENFSKRQYTEIMTDRKNFSKVQLSFLFGLIIVYTTLMLIFKDSVIIDYLILGVVPIFIFIFIPGVILINIKIGKSWREYSKWYRLNNSKRL